MKKKTKILASVLSAAIMAASAVAPVSAGLSFSGKISRLYHLLHKYQHEKN